MITVHKLMDLLERVPKDWQVSAYCKEGGGCGLKIAEPGTDGVVCAYIDAHDWESEERQWKFLNYFGGS